MARHRKIPKRLPPVTREIQNAIQALQNFLGTISKFEKDSISLENARLAIMPEQEKKESKHPELTDQIGTEQPKERKTRKKKIDLSAVPGDDNATEQTSTENQP